MSDAVAVHDELPTYDITVLWPDGMETTAFAYGGYQSTYEVTGDQRYAGCAFIIQYTGKGQSNAIR